MSDLENTVAELKAKRTYKYISIALNRTVYQLQRTCVATYAMDAGVMRVMP